MGLTVRVNIVAYLLDPRGPPTKLSRSLRAHFDTKVCHLEAEMSTAAVFLCHEWTSSKAEMRTAVMRTLVFVKNIFNQNGLNPQIKGALIGVTNGPNSQLRLTWTNSTVETRGENTFTSRGKSESKEVFAVACEIFNIQ